MLLTNDSAGHRHLPPSGGAGPSQWPRPESPPGVTANGARGSGTGSPTVTQNQPRAKLWLRAPGEHHGRGAGQAQLWLGNPAPPLSWSVSVSKCRQCYLQGRSGTSLLAAVPTESNPSMAATRDEGHLLVADSCVLEASRDERLPTCTGEGL